MMESPINTNIEKTFVTYNSYPGDENYNSDHDLFCYIVQCKNIENFSDYSKDEVFILFNFNNLTDKSITLSIDGSTTQHLYSKYHYLNILFVDFFSNYISLYILYLTDKELLDNFEIYEKFILTLYKLITDYNINTYNGIFYHDYFCRYLYLKNIHDKNIIINNNQLIINKTNNNSNNINSSDNFYKTSKYIKKYKKSKFKL